MARSNGKRRRSVRDISEDEIIDALEDILSSADKTTVNLVSEGLADRFGVQRAEIKERSRDVILQRLGSPAALSAATDHRARSTCSSGDARSKSRGASSASTVAALLVQEPSHSTVDGRSTTPGTQRTTSRGSSTSASSIDDVTGTFPVQSKLQRSAGSRIVKSRLPSVPTPRGLSKLKDLAKAAGLLSPRSGLSRSLKAANSSKHEEDLLRVALDNADVTFSGRYPSKANITKCKAARDLTRELEDIDATNIMPSAKKRCVSSRTSSFSDPPTVTRGDPLAGFVFSDDEEKEDESDASASSEAEV